MAATGQGKVQAIRGTGGWTIQRLPDRGRLMLWVVCRADEWIGTVEKYRDTRTEWHPFKAYQASYGRGSRFLGSFYPDRSTLPGVTRGGKAAAIRAILAARHAI